MSDFIRNFTFVSVLICSLASAVPVTTSNTTSEASLEAQSNLNAALARLSTAQLEVQRGQTELDYYQADRDRKQDMYSVNAIPGKDYWESKLKAEQADIALKELENGVTQAQSDVDVARGRLDKLEGH
jgi:type II secretory pathway pseudopilin PulG